MGAAYLHTSSSSSSSSSSSLIKFLLLTPEDFLNKKKEVKEEIKTNIIHQEAQKKIRVRIEKNQKQRNKRNKRNRVSHSLKEQKLSRPF